MRGDPTGWIKLLWKHPLPFAATLLLGASGAFLYSYGPLHSGKNWQIEHLEQRVDQQNEKLKALALKLAQARAEAEGRPESGEFAKLKEEAEKARGEISRLEAKLRRANGSIASLRESRDRWQAQHAAVAEELEKGRAEPEQPLALPASPATFDPPAPAEFPGAAPETEPLAEGPAPVPSFRDDAVE
jgi:hypothetical protein